MSSTASNAKAATLSYKDVKIQGYISSKDNNYPKTYHKVPKFTDLAEADLEIVGFKKLSKLQENSEKQFNGIREETGKQNETFIKETEITK